MVEVVIDPTTLARSARRGITGEIFLRTSNEYFPDQRWSDFPVVILAWWIDGLDKLATGNERVFEGLFMDGPFTFKVTKDSAATASVAWGKRDEEFPVGDADVTALLRSTLEAGRHVIAACELQGWSSPEIRNLAAAISRSAA